MTRPTFTEIARKARRAEAEKLIARMDTREVVDLLYHLLTVPFDASDRLHDAILPACVAFEAEWGVIQGELQVRGEAA